MSQGENDFKEVQRLIDQTEIHPTGMSQGDSYDEVVEHLSAKLIEGDKKTEFFFSSPCIHRVPKELRELKKSAYTPRLIAIGPLHRNDPHLQTSMQHVKLSYANKLLSRLTEGMEYLQAEQKKITVLGECMAAMKTSLDDARKCYPEEVTLDVEIMLVDGCFILELLYRGKLFPGYPEGCKTADPIFGSQLNYRNVQHDLLLLENQIPFLVLERLFPLTLARIPNNPHENLSLTDYVFRLKNVYAMRIGGGDSTNSTGSAKTSCWPRDCVLWVSSNKTNNFKPDEKVSSSNANYYHILHKLHDDYIPHDQTGKEGSHFMPSASELDYAGVKFVRGTGNDQFKIKFTEPKGPFWWFCSARFEIPSFEVDDRMEPFLRNLIACEQCCSGISEHFTSYAILMDRLVNSAKDVQVLEKAGIIHNRLGASEDVTNLFNNLSKEVLIREFFFAETCDRATRYSKRFRPKNMAHLRRQYFASPWTFIAFCLGFVSFCLNIADVIISIGIFQNIE